MPRLPTDKEFQHRFNQYVRSMGGECLDELVPPRPNGPKLADYLLWDRAVVAEMKCITVDQLSNPAVGERAWRVIQNGFHAGQVGSQHLVGDRLRLDQTVDARLRQEVVDQFRRPMKRLAGYASQQIRSTADEFSLATFHGLFILVNLADRRLTADFATTLLRRVLREHQSTLNYVAFYSPHIGAERMTDGSRATLSITGMNGDQPAHLMDRVKGLMRGWLAFNEGQYLS